MAEGRIVRPVSVPHHVSARDDNLRRTVEYGITNNLALIDDKETAVEQAISQLTEREIELAQTKAVLFAHDAIRKIGTGVIDQSRIEARMDRLNERIEDQENAVKRAQKTLNTLKNELESMRKKLIKGVGKKSAMSSDYMRKLRTHFADEMESFEPLPDFDLRS